MTVSLEQLTNHLRHALQGGTPSSLLSELEIINDAGDHLFSTHPWKFAERPPLDLDLVAGQNFIALPADFGEVIRFARNTDWIVLVSAAEMARQDSDTELDGDSGATYFGTLVGPRVDPNDTADDARLPRILLTPTPSANRPAAVRMYWRAGWRRLSQAGDIANVPPWAEGLLKLIVREYARGLENDALPETLEVIERSTLLQKAKERDGMAQASFGEVRGGDVENLGIASDDGLLSWLDTELATGP